MPDDIKLLDEIFKYVDLEPEYKEFAKKKLFKYVDDPIVQCITDIVSSLTDRVSNTISIFKEVGAKEFNKIGKAPLVVLCPDKLDHLRVYPNIIFDKFDENCVQVSPMYTGNIKEFLAEYEADLQDDAKKNKWNSPERYTKRLNEFLDMPTARAITRYLVPDGSLKDSVIRDWATRIDTLRRPLEITFAENPKDFVRMYSNGPHSCMADSAGEHDKWAFFGEELCPTSFFAYWPGTKGAFVAIGDKVVARAILYTNDLLFDTVDPRKVTVKEDAHWYHGRIYSTTPEYDRKFKSSLSELGIKPLTNTYEPAKGTKITVKGFPIRGSNPKDPWDATNCKNFALPFPYFDNMVTNPMRISYDPATHEFTITYSGNNKDGAAIKQRSGYLTSLDYTKVHCSNCGKELTGKITLDVEDPVMTFCSDNCAEESGFVLLLDGAGHQKYTRPDPKYLDFGPTDFVKISTFKAGCDLGYFPFMEEIGVFPEEEVTRFECSLGSQEGRIVNGEGSAYYLYRTDIKGSTIKPTPTKIPVSFKDKVKTVFFDDSAPLYVEEACPF